MPVGTAKRCGGLVLVGVIAASILYFMLREVVRGWPLIVGYPWNLSVPYVILSVALATGSAMLGVKAGHVLAEVLGAKTSFRRFIFILCTTQTSRYLPGRIWGVLGLSVMLEREGVARASAVVLPVMHQGMMTLVLGVMGAGLYACRGDGGIVHPLEILLPSLSFLGLATILLMPFFLQKVGGVLSRRVVKLPSLAGSKRGYYSALGFLVSSAICLAGAFGLFVAGVVKFPWADAPFVAGGFLLSYVLGWLAFFLPGGIGVREGSLACLLGPVFGTAVGSVVALAARVWMTSVEIMLLFGVWVWVKIIKREAFV